MVDRAFQSTLALVKTAQDFKSPLGLVEQVVKVILTEEKYA